MRRRAWALLAAAALAAAPGPARAGTPPSTLEKADFQALLQSFVSQVYLKGFRHLGDERDFDHGHILRDAADRPLAVLYHTQELALGEPAGSDFAYIDSKRRNWIQWIESGLIEDAARYRRSSYPHTAAWDWFRLAEMPALDENGTVLDKMLDPLLVAVDVSKSEQWVFTRVGCASPEASGGIRIALPRGGPVCLSLSPS